MQSQYPFFLKFWIQWKKKIPAPTYQDGSTPGHPDGVEAGVGHLGAFLRLLKLLLRLPAPRTQQLQLLCFL